MTDDRWDKLDALAAAATPGPWFRPLDNIIASHPDRDPEAEWTIVIGYSTVETTPDDAEFIAACDPATIRDLVAAARERDELRDDAEKWRAAEAEGHVVDFTETGFGLQHPPSCRPDLIDCWFNVYLADLGYPDEEPGRYRMTRQTGGVVEYTLLREAGA